MVKYIFSCVVLFSFSLVFSQSGPGGIGNSVNNSFWLDANELVLTNNSSVNSFTDVSGNSNNFIQGSSNFQPTYLTGVVNGLPVVRFDGVNDMLLSGSISDIESSDVTWFVVYKKNATGADALIGANYDSNPKQWSTYSHGGNDKVYSVHHSGSIQHTSYIDDYANYNFLSTHITPTSIKLYKEGVLAQSKNATYNAPTGHNFVVLGKYPSFNFYYLDGDIAEVIVYNTDINDLERIIIENYLGAKYNLSIPSDFYSYQATHNLSVVGVGDDGTDIHSDSKGHAQIELSSPLGMTSGEYLFIGHNGIDIQTLVDSDLPPSISTHSRWDRTWRVGETGDVGDLTVTIDVSGTNGFADPTTYNLLVDSDGDFSNATVVAGVFNAGDQTMIFNVDLADGDFITLSGEFAPKNIHSIVSGNWSNANTWDCTCLPTIYDTVFIDNNDVVTVDAESYTNRLNITTNATLVMNQNFNLNLHGDLNILGAFTATDGGLSILGSSDQTINAGGNSVDYLKIIINNSTISNVDFINGTHILNDLLDPISGVMNINNGGFFIVNSVGTTTTGQIGEMQSAFSVNGTVTVRRFLPAGNAVERTLSSPVIGANLSMWDETIPISGEGFPDGCALGDECYHSCKVFEGGNFAANYIDITNPNEALVSGKGYELFLGNDLNTWAGATISSTGTLHDANDFVYNSLEYRWNIVGNPFASPVLFSTIDKIDIYNYYYVFDAASGSYQWYDAVSNTSSLPEMANGNLAIGQGYWIYAGFTGPSLGYKQSDKASSAATFIRSAGQDKSIYINLTQNGTTYKNIVNIDFNEMSEDGVDSLDVKAFTVGNQQSSSIYINYNDELLAKSSMLDNGLDKIVDMSLKILNNGYYTLSISNFDNNDLYDYITLYDSETKQIIELKEVPEYTFYSGVGEFNRFRIVLSNKKIIGSTSSAILASNNNVTVTQIGNSINVEAIKAIEGVSEITVYNLVGQEIAFNSKINIQKGDNLVFVSESLKGMYIVKVNTNDGIYTKKILF